MERPIQYVFSSLVLLEQIIMGNLPNWCTFQIPYAEVEQTDIEAEIIVFQLYSHFLFFMEVVEIKLHKALEAGFFIDKPSMILSFMLKGGMTTLAPSGQVMTKVLEQTCSASFNKTGEYRFRLSAGTYRLCYLSPRPGWITKNLERVTSFLAICLPDRRKYEGELDAIVSI